MRDPVENRVFTDDLKRLFVMSQLFKYAADSIRISDTVKEIVNNAKASGVKKPKDLRVIANDALLSVNSMLIKLKDAAPSPETWRAITTHMACDSVHELMNVLDILVLFKDDEIIKVRELLQEGIRLNNKDVTS